jgi:uncharacterized membrane protein YbhN (UPF0104 family)
MPAIQNKFIVKLRSALDDVFLTILSSFNNIRTLFVLLLTAISMLILRFTWYAVLLNGLSIDAPQEAIAVLTLAAEMANIFTFIPGNIGVSEGLTGAVFSAYGQNVGVGILIEMIIRLSTMVLAFSVGFWAILYNMHLLGIRSIRAFKEDLVAHAKTIYYN